MYPGIEAHDLGHYAVETVLGFKNAFYGMVAKGNNIEDFELPREKRPAEVRPKNLSNEALVTEHLVNLLMVKAQSHDSTFDILVSLKSILNENNLHFPEQLDLNKMEEIQAKFNKLLHKWNVLAMDSILEMEFSMD